MKAAKRDMVEYVNMQRYSQQCCLCGWYDDAKWGVPVATDGPDCGLIVANDYPGEWAGKPACRECWAEHERGLHVGTDPAY